ncbi:hypothetical protein YC2023_077371 [Brassica napus]
MSRLFIVKFNITVTNQVLSLNVMKHRYSEEGLMESVPKNAWLVYEVEAVKHFNKLNSPHCFKFVTGYCYVIGSGNFNKMESKLRGKGQRVHICTKSGQLVSIWVIEICIPHRHVTAQRRPSISA